MKLRLILLLTFIVCKGVFAQNTGVGTTTPASKLTTNGNLSVGAGYMGTAAPANGAIIEGNVGIGTTITAPNVKLTISTPDNAYGFLHTNGTISLGSYIGSGATTIGTTTAHDFSLVSNNLKRVNVTASGNVGINQPNPGAKLEIASGTSNVSGLKFSNFNSATAIGTGQTIGVDADGNVITLANPTPTTATTVEYASATAAAFNVDNLVYTTVTGTPQTITIPAGGKALFINFMMGIDYNNFPAGGGSAYYRATLFVDGVASNVYQTTQEPASGGAQAQFNLSTVKFLAAGSHVIDVRMIRSSNNGTTSGANMNCIPLSISFNATYLN